MQSFEFSICGSFFCAKNSVERRLESRCIMHDTLYSFCINFDTYHFDTTQLFDVTFLLRNIIVTLKVRQKPPRNDFRGGFHFKFN